VKLKLAGLRLIVGAGAGGVEEACTGVRSWPIPGISERRRPVDPEPFELPDADELLDAAAVSAVLPDGVLLVVDGEVGDGPTA
jgi:hypothetical protein